MTGLFPRISIVTPSFNQSLYIEQTINSVLSQGYPNLEYIIIDGGSTDDSIDIIRRHQAHLKYWVSERDRGQTHAINKGMGLATGEIRAYLNSDDYYLPGTFEAVADYFMSHSEVDLVNGRCRYVNECGETIGGQFSDIERYDQIVDVWDVWRRPRHFVQPEVFWTRRIADEVGPFTENLHYGMDYDYWLRILKAGGKVGHIDRELSCFRCTRTQKTSQRAQVTEELLSIVQPELWDASTPIVPAARRRMQGQWLFHRKFRVTANQSVALGESRLRRWLRLLGALSRHPQLLYVPEFRHHVLATVHGMLTSRLESGS
jgi:glycosyltransferase involved in cell wall biosynthesis